MSHSKVNNIRINADTRQVQLKHSDSNVFPKDYKWSDWLSIKELYENWRVGNVQFNQTANEKLCLVNYVFRSFGWDGYKGKFFYEVSCSIVRDEASEDEKLWYETLLESVENSILDHLKDYTPKKNYILKIGNNFFKKIKAKNLYTTANLEDAKKFSYYHSLQVTKNGELNYGLKVSIKKINE